MNDGGGISNAGSLTLTNIDLYGNNATNGGAVFTDAGSTLIASNVSMWLNTASNWGGGIYSYESMVSFQSGSQIFANTAKDGGGIYDYDTAFSQRNLTISGSSQIYANSASDNGGGIYDWNGAMSMTGGKIQGNSAGNNGGGTYIDGTGTQANVALTDVSLTQNSAKNGGGFYLSVGILGLWGTCTVKGNTAGVGPGGLWKAGSTYSAAASCTITDAIAGNQ
jgi:hypothetical protein